MVWVMGLFMLAAIICIWMDCSANKKELKELRHRVNIMDEVTTLHSEEIDELQRSKLPMATRIADLEKWRMEPSWEQAVNRVQELEGQSGKPCEIKAAPSSVSAEH